MAKTAAGVLFAIALMAVITPATVAVDNCTVNVNCDISLDGMEIDANHVVRTHLQNSVVRIWDPEANEPAGTGTLINNLQCGDATAPQPYVLTAWHVINDALIGGYLDQLVFEFNYLPASCDAPSPDTVPAPAPGAHTITGAAVVAGASLEGYYEHKLFADFVLLRLMGDPADSARIEPDRWSHVFFAGWSRDTSISSPVVTLGHPSGWPMKLSADLHSPLKESDSGFGEQYAPDLQYIWEIPSLEFGGILPCASGSGLFTFSDVDCKLIGVIRSFGGCDWSGIPTAVRFDKGWDYRYLGCCLESLGNADNDDLGSVTIGDLSVIIDSLFINGADIPCTQEADVNLSGGISIGDVNVLIDHLFVNEEPLPNCDDLRALPNLPPEWIIYVKDFLDPDGLDLDSLNGWAPGETYPNWTGCQ